MIDSAERRTKELSRLWCAYKRLGSVELRNQLFDSYLFMVEATVNFCLRRCWGALRQPDEMRAEATVGLLRAIDRFDPTVGTCFETFAFHAVRGAVRDWLRRESWRKLGTAQRSIYYRREQTFTDTHFPDRWILDLHGHDPAVTAERRDFFEAALRRCTPGEQQVLDLFYRHNLSQREISERIGVTQGYISQVHRRARERLQRYYAAHS